MPRFDVFYVRGDFAGDRPEMSVVVRDAKSLLAVPREVLVSLSQDFENYPGFLSHAELLQIGRARISDRQQADKVVGLIVRLSRFLQQRSMSAPDLLDSIATWRSEPDNADRDLLSEDEFAGLRDRIPILVRSYQGLVRQGKAERLATATGARLESVETISDLRPIYDDAHESIVGVIPLTTLKIVYNSVAGLPSAVEIALTETQVEELANRASQAKKKLQTLKGLAEEFEKTIPVVAATMPVATPIPSVGR